MSETNVSTSTSDVLLIKLETGELWRVAFYALKERGIPDGWTCYEDVTKEELLYHFRKASNILDDDDKESPLMTIEYV